ncbi:hypothetical protein BZG02_18125 [Labilibaculum filiforme]|uniref:Uncharacterized protein n=1 Tax=Labilibaculum filiforme TaxID=1940526 RepID=A0A2N3HRY8_9BACT|nr:hypothetical protein [Labilibaculum filiforme]PKQ60787.1 hypothetical protein BZG02_18125 [Labilibaculum filiforme]
MKKFEDYKGSGWGHETRREMFFAACKYLGQNPTHIENIYGAGFHSVLQTSTVQLTGEGLNKVKNDPEIQSLQTSIVRDIKSDSDYKKAIVTRSITKNIQLGGQRADAAMWKQALGISKWADEYSPTWQVACNELTWLLRSVPVRYRAQADTSGKITISYRFTDTFDLRPNWQTRSMEYNAICTVLGVIYHDVIGCNDELKIQGSWVVAIND